VYNTDPDAQPANGPVILESGWHDSWGYNAGGGLTMDVGHKRQLFLEGRVINYRAGSASMFEKAHQFPLILGINWY